MDKKVIIGLLIVLIILIAIYLYMGSATPPENLTQSSNINHSNVSGIFV
jgi:hypothetical protein